MCLERLIVSTSGPRIFYFFIVVPLLYFEYFLKKRLRLKIQFGVIIHFPEILCFFGGFNRL